MRCQVSQLHERRRADGLEQGGRERPLAAGHRREQDHGRALANRRVEPVEHADVLAVEVDVHEGRDAFAVVENLPPEAGEARSEVGEHVAHRRAGRLDLARAADLGAQGGRDANLGHGATCRAGPWQNST